MAFEYDRIKRLATMKAKFIYFFKSSIILDPILPTRKNSGICGFPIGPIMLIA
jgi:hypothetical protein